MATDKRTSERFYSGYGDFTLQSSDGVICHFPKCILSYSSEVFRSMFLLPTGHGIPSQGTVSNPLAVTERADVLESFLDHIDPNTISPPLNPQIVVDVLEMAHKYNTPVIFSWFQEVVKLRHYNQVSNKTVESLLTLDPLRVLYISLKYDLEAVGKWAMKELLGCSSHRLVFTEPGIPITTMGEIIIKRKERFERYKTYIQLLASGQGSPQSMAHWRQRLNYFEVAASCLPCALSRIQWILWLNEEIQNSPQWSTFRRCLHDVPEAQTPFCSKHQNAWSFYSSGFTSSIEAEVKALEEQEIRWPL